MERFPVQTPEKLPSIEVQRAKVEDAEQIQEVFYKTWLTTYPNEEHGITIDDIEERLKGLNAGERLEKRKEQIQFPPPNELFLVAKSDTNVIGVSRGVRHENKNQLQAIYVLPEFQGKGVGASMWKEMQNFFVPSLDTYVEVATYNKNAVDFYSKLGFVDTGRRWKDKKFQMKSGAILPQMEMVRRAGRTSE